MSWCPTLVLDHDGGSLFSRFFRGAVRFGCVEGVPTYLGFAYEVLHKMVDIDIFLADEHLTERFLNGS